MACSLSLKILELGIIANNLKEDIFLPNIKKFNFFRVFQTYGTHYPEKLYT